MNAVWRGAAAGWHGVRRAATDRELRAAWASVALLWCLVWCGFFALAVSYDDVAAARMMQALPAATADAGWWSLAWRKIVVALVYPLVWLSAWLAALVASFPALSPALSWWSELVQRRLRGELAAFSLFDVVREGLRGIGRSIVLATAELVCTLLLNAVGWSLALLLPGIGPLAQSLLLTGSHLLWRAMFVVSYPLENNAVPLTGQLRLLREQYAFLLGVGLWAGPLCVLVPLAPLAVAAGTSAVLTLHDEGLLLLPRAAAARR